jgi:hypothetical protein
VLQKGLPPYYDTCCKSLVVFFYDKPLAKHIYRRQMSIGIYQFKGMITESQQKAQRNKIGRGVGVRPLWNGGNPG